MAQTPRKLPEVNRKLDLDADIPTPEDYVAWATYVKGPNSDCFASEEPDHLVSPLFFNLTLLKWRTYLMLSRYDASKLLGVHLTTYANWENGTVLPKYIVRKTICDYIKKWLPRGLELDDVVEAVREWILAKKNKSYEAACPTLGDFIEGKAERPKRLQIVPPKNNQESVPRRQQIMDRIIEIVKEKKIAKKREIHDEIPWLSHVELVSILLTMVNSGKLDRLRTSKTAYVYWIKGDKEAEELAKKLAPRRMAV